MSANVFSIYGLISWLERQGPATRYDYVVSGTCLLTKYFESRGIERGLGGMDYGPISIEDTDWGKIARDGEWTYGAALGRARDIVLEETES